MYPAPLETLLRASSSGDVGAFADLYDAMAPRIHGLVRRILADPHQSEEVTQEVFLQVWQTSGRFDPDRGSALAWLMTIAHHKAVDRVRRTEGSRRRDASDAQRSVVTPYDETATAAHASVDAQAVRAALGLLTPIQRQAVELAYFSGYTHNEVSAFLQVPLSTAKTRIRDGLIRLRDEVLPLEGDHIQP